MKPLRIFSYLYLLIHALLPTAVASIAENCKRFGDVMISRVDSQDESPEHVVAFLNLNWKNSDPPVTRMDLKLAPKSFTGKSVTITARNIKFSDLLGQLAEQLDAEIVIQAEGILLRPAEDMKSSP